MVGVWLVLGGILGARHEAQFAHVVDARTGEIRHADVIAGSHRDTAQAAYHGSATRSDGDVCGIATALHQAARPTPPISPHVALDRRVDPAALIHHDDTIALAAIYRFAPKTSPPTRG